MALTLTITDAGRAAVVNATNTGTGPVLISEIAFGTGQYTPAPTATALQNEVSRLSTVGGVVVADDTIHVVAQDDSNDAYNVGEFGLFTDGGVLFALYSQTGSWIMQKSSAATLLLGVDVILQTLSASSLTFGDLTFSAPPATTSSVGVVQLNDTVTSTSTSQAATPNAVKTANDNANSRVPSTRTLTAGNGLTGGGALSANRTITLGTPEKITATSTNSVSPTGHSHEVDAATTLKPGVVQLNNTINSTSTSQAATPNAVKTAYDKGAEALDAASNANDNANSRVPSTRTLTAGNGLTGGGALSANRTITLGTPEKITATSTNSVSPTGHSHEVDADSIVTANRVLSGVAASYVGGIGTYALLCEAVSNVSQRVPGDVLPGSSLQYAALNDADGLSDYTGNTGVITSGTSPAGTWRLMGGYSNLTTNANDYVTSLWVRIA